jgi:homoserine O-acetyltransferase
VERGRFPKVTLHDNVRLQHQLITERLGIERLRLVTGFSMGRLRPDRQLQQSVPPGIAARARARPCVRRRLLPPPSGERAEGICRDLRRLGHVRTVFREEVFGALGSRSTAEHVADFWEPFFLRCDANNLLSQLWTWEAGDISANPTFGFDFEAALSAIKARTIIVPIDNDRYFPPVDSKNEAKHIPGARISIVASTWAIWRW